MYDTDFDYVALGRCAKNTRITDVEDEKERRTTCAGHIAESYRNKLRPQYERVEPGDLLQQHNVSELYHPLKTRHRVFGGLWIGCLALLFHLGLFHCLGCHFVRGEYSQFHLLFFGRLQPRPGCEQY